MGTRTRREVEPGPTRPDQIQPGKKPAAPHRHRCAPSLSPRRLTAASQPHPPLSSASPGYKYPPARISRDPPSRSRPLPAPPPRPAHELRRAPAPASAALRSGPPVKARTSKGGERGKGEAHPPAISRLRILSCSIRVGSPGVAKRRGSDGGGTFRGWSRRERPALMRRRVPVLGHPDRMGSSRPGKFQFVRPR